MRTTQAKPMALPNTRTFITNLLTSLKHTTQTADNPMQPSQKNTANPLKNFTDNQKALLMTLHVLYPNELLPALDLLDRDLVTQFTLAPQTPDEAAVETSTLRDSTDEPLRTEPGEHGDGSSSSSSTSTSSSTGGIYFVRSAQHTNPNSKRYRDPVASSTHYEVRTSSWSCSCPAFAFSAFPASDASMSVDAGVEDCGDEDEAGELGLERHGGWGVGGLTLGERVPVCKHLLACALVEGAAPLFGGFVRREEVGVEELAGWAAGWGG